MIQDGFHPTEMAEGLSRAMIALRELREVIASLEREATLLPVAGGPVEEEERPEVEESLERDLEAGEMLFDAIIETGHEKGNL